MLIQFSIENYRSIKERQTLSMVTSTSKIERSRCLLHTGFKAAPALLEVTAIYGPNGSGKSTLVNAMDFFQDFVMDSHKLQPGEPIDAISPFLFSKKTTTQPSTFEAVFVKDNFLFQYGFTADNKKVHDEWLYATPAGNQKQKPQTWFKRNSKDIKQSTIKRELKGAKEAWKEGTGENHLFLSVAANRQSEDFKKPFNWIKSNLRVLTSPGRLHYGYTANQILQNKRKKNIISLMKDLDLFFDDVSVVEKTLAESDFKGLDKLPPSVKEELLKEMLGKKHTEVFTRHKIEEGGHCTLPLESESAGTQQLFALAGPIIDVFEGGSTLVVDEIHNSLHPLALKKIISLFQDKEVNKKNSQLIFTTHDTNAMNYLERDQIWLLEKRKFGNTTFSALSEFKGRPDEAIEKRYLGGRYGAIPNIESIN